MLFRFREIRTAERIVERRKDKEKSKKYLEIKPETNITYEEAKAFVESLFKGSEQS